MPLRLQWDSASADSSTKPQSGSLVTMPSNFTFVESGEPSSGGGPSSTGSKNIVRSRAMQSVWAQRGKNQADKNRDAAFVIETADTFDQRAAAKVPPSKRRQSTTSSRKCQGRRASPTEDARKRNGIAQTVHKSNRSDQPGSPNSYENPQKSPILVDIDDETVVEVERDQSVQQQIQDAVVEARADILEPMDTMVVGTLDPFQMACIHMDTKSNAYLHHYFRALSWKFTMPKKIWLRLAMESPALLQSVLFVSSAHYGVCTTKKQALTLDARRVAGNLIHEITECMRDPIKRVSDATIAAIARLITWSIIQGNKEAFAKHSKCIDHLIQLRGGLNALGYGGQLRYLICCNTFGAASIWMDAIPESLRYPYGPLDYSALDDVSAIQISPESASSFIELQESGWLPSDVTDVCIGMAKLDALLAGLQEFQTNEHLQTMFGHCNNQLALRLIYGTHREVQTLQGTAPGVDVMIREVARTTALCYLLAFQRDAPAFSPPVVENLKRVKLWIDKSQNQPGLQLRDAWGGGKLGELLFWVLLINGTIMLHPQLKQELAQHLRTVAEALNINTWKRVQEVCKGFLWQVPLVERRCTLFWNDIFYFPTFGTQTLSLGQSRALREAKGSMEMSRKGSRGSDRGTPSQINSSGPKSANSRASSSTTLRESIERREGSPELGIPPLNTEDSTASDGSVTSGCSPPMANMPSPNQQAVGPKDGRRAVEGLQSNMRAVSSDLRSPGTGASDSQKHAAQKKGRRR